MKMNKMTKDVRFVTMEDITGSPGEQNPVVYNTALPVERRKALFQKHMSSRYPNHKFTEEELDQLMSFDELHLVEFVKLVKLFITGKAYT